jgi:hypothetical protein
MVHVAIAPWRPAFTRAAFALLLVVFTSGTRTAQSSPEGAAAVLEGVPFFAVSSGADDAHATDLRTSTYSTAYRRSLDIAWRQLQHWWSTEAPTTLLDSLAANPLALDRMLCRYVQVLFNKGAYVHEAVHVLLALQWRHRQLRQALLGAWNMVRNWRASLPVTMRTPVPQDIALAVSRWCIGRGLTLGAGNPDAFYYIAGGIGVLIAFYGLLRPSELCSMVRASVTVPGDGASVRGQAFLRAGLVIFSPKNWRHMGRHQVSSIDDSSAVAWLVWLCRDADPLTKLFPSLPIFRRIFKVALSALGLDALNLTLAGLRAGGATFVFERDRDLHRIMSFGRWES